MIFLKANFEHIPAYGDIPKIPAKDIQACLPARFLGPDADMMVAEAAFDVLRNTTAPTANGMDLNYSININTNINRAKERRGGRGGSRG